MWIYITTIEKLLINLEFFIDSAVILIHKMTFAEQLLIHFEI